MMLFFDNQWMHPLNCHHLGGNEGGVRPQASLEMAFALASETCHHMGNANSSITSRMLKQMALARRYSA